MVLTKPGQETINMFVKIYKYHSLLPQNDTRINKARIKKIKMKKIIKNMGKYKNIYIYMKPIWIIFKNSK